MRRRQFIRLLGGAVTMPLLWPLPLGAQTPERGKRIAVLSGFTPGDPEAQARMAAFQAGLKDLGWTDGRNLRVDFRWGGGGGADDMRRLAREAVDLRPDVILAVTTPAVGALLQETRTIPIVFVQVTDPVGSGYVANLARPGGNVTGFLTIAFSMAGKWLETLKQIAPKVTRVGFLFNPDTAPFAKSFVTVAEAAARSIAVQTTTIPVRSKDDIESAVAAFAATPGGGLIPLPDVFTASQRDTIVALAARYRLPAVYPFRYFAVSGGLVSDGVDTVDSFRRAASYVDRIFRGAAAGDLPVQAPAKLELVVNLRTAKAMGIDIPPTLIARADEVIE
jgi:putative tryptophan/tyrosine transport system substrate-binding protein